MSAISLQGSTALLTPKPPGSFILAAPVSSIPGGKQMLLTVAGKAALIQDDIDTWVKTFISPYTNADYSTPGMVKGQSATIEQLAENTTASGKNLVLASSVITIELSVMAPATSPAKKPPNDPMTSYQADVKLLTTQTQAASL